MNAQIQKVTYYIENHLNDDLDVRMLAKIAGYSHFHFCRIFKLSVGESMISYAIRLRLERASSEVRRGKKSMIEIALDAGYQTPTGFLKAFKVRFGTTPTEYKSTAKVQHYIYKEKTMTNAKIVHREEAHVVFTRELGSYEKSSDIAWKRLSGQMEGLGEQFVKTPPSFEMDLKKGEGEALGICHDNPKVTDENNLRYDAALGWGEAEVKELEKYGFKTKKIAGGKFATVSYQCQKEGAENAWYGLYAWIEKNGYEFRDEPAFEKYLNAWNETDKSKIKTEIYVPIL